MGKIFVSCLIFVSSTALGAVPPHVSPILEKELLSLQVKLSETSARLEKFQEIQKTLLEIQSYQEAQPAVSKAEQGRVQLLVAVLEALPKARGFNVKDCEKYRNEYLEEFEPMAEEAPEDPSVLYGWDVLEKLCR
ncbi:hypothetical protein BDW_09865 [Bdellovibrio bacteriovorus W]|nr:hypothetical protein BDW_09865 [Bdellovibrio bacteriovorus W]